MTAEEYIESLRQLGPRTTYLFGERVENPVDHPMVRPSINACAMTYRLVEIPEYQDLATAISALTGRRINRFVHLHQSPEDLVKGELSGERPPGQRLQAERDPVSLRNRPSGA